MPGKVWFGSDRYAKVGPCAVRSMRDRTSCGVVRDSQESGMVRCGRDRCGEQRFGLVRFGPKGRYGMEVSDLLRWVSAVVCCD